MTPGPGPMMCPPASRPGSEYTRVDSFKVGLASLSRTSHGDGSGHHFHTVLTFSHIVVITSYITNCSAVLSDNHIIKKLLLINFTL